jgi:hypothetical protein
MHRSSAHAGVLIPAERLEQARAERESKEERRAYLRDPSKPSHGDDHEDHGHGLYEATKAAVYESVREREELSEVAEIALSIEREDARIEPDEDDIAAASMFPIPSRETRALARSLAAEVLGAMWRIGRVPAPTFEAAGNGGIGLHWKSDRAELLIVIPPERTSRVLFLAQAPGRALVKGWSLLGDTTPLPIEWFAKLELSR